jgi:hypothetical protein
MMTLSKFAAALLVAAPLVAMTASAADEKPKNQVSRDAGKLLQQAQDLIKKDKYQDGIAVLDKVDAVQKKNPYDVHVQSDLYRYAYSKLGNKAKADEYAEKELSDGFETPEDSNHIVQALAVDDFNAKSYDKAIDYGMRAIKGGFGGETMYTVVAQAYYIKGDWHNTIKFVDGWVDADIKKGETPKEQTLSLVLSSCVKLNDQACETHALERLVLYYPKPEYWQNLTFTLLNQKGNSDPMMLNIYRLAFQVNALNTSDQFTEMAELAMEEGSPGEAQRVLEKGIAQNVFTDQRTKDRATRLLETAKKRAASDQAGLPKLAQDADKAKTGDAEVALGLAYLSYQDCAKAVDALNNGLTKGSLKSEGQARLLLGIAQLCAGNKADATKTFHSIKGDATLEHLANLWVLYAHQAEKVASNSK